MRARSTSFCPAPRSPWSSPSAAPRRRWLQFATTSPFSHEQVARPRPRRSTQVRHRDLNSGDPSQMRVENIRDFPCASNDTCTSNGDDLGSITRPRQNHNLTDIQFRFQRLDNLGAWQDADWGDEYVPATLTCTDDRN